MKVINRTKYLTNDLRSLFLACIKRQTDDKWIKEHLEVEVEYEGTKGRTYSRATYNGSWMRILIYKDKMDKPNYTRRLAWLFCHELEHTKGKHHKDMRGSYWLHWPTDGYKRLEWADDFPLRIKPDRPKAKKDIQLARYENVLKHIKQAQTKTKRWHNILKKWTTKKRYYEKVLVANKKL